MKTLEERKEDFKMRVYELDEPKDRLDAFYDYWAEHNDGGKKMRFELSKNQPFNTKRRMGTWKKIEQSREETIDKARPIVQHDTYERPKLEITEEERRKNTMTNIMLAYDHWKAHKELPLSYTCAFDSLYEMGVFPNPNTNDMVRDWYAKMAKAGRTVAAYNLRQKEIKLKAQPGSKGTKELLEVRNTHSEILKQGAKHPIVAGYSKLQCLVVLFKKYTKDEIKERIEETY